MTPPDNLNGLHGIGKKQGVQATVFVENLGDHVLEVLYQPLIGLGIRRAHQNTQREARCTFEPRL